MYEISFILKEEDASSIKKVFSSYEVEVPALQELRKIRLAYPIKKSEYGFLGYFTFETSPENLEKIFKDLKLKEDLFRYMVTKPGEKETEVKEGRRVTQAAAPYSKKTDEPKRHPDPVLTNEELEKKIEEILK